MKRLILSLCAVVACVSVQSACRDPQATKRRHIQAADGYVTQKKFNDAVLEYRNALKIDAKDGDVRYKLADTYMQIDRQDLAGREYLRAADLLPDRADVQVKAAAIVLGAGDFTRARQFADTALKADEKNLDAQIIRAEALAGLRDLPTAVKEIQEAVQLAPGSGRTYVTLGTLEARTGKIEEAERAFKRAVEVDPKSVTARLALAHFLWSRRDLEGAESQLKAALSLSPDDRLANEMTAVFYAGIGRDAQAELALHHLADLGDANAISALGDYYLKNGRLDDARPLFERLKQSPTSKTTAAVRLAEIEYVKGNKEAARAQLAAVLKETPANVDALIARAKWLLVEHRADDAYEAAKAAVAADGSSASAQYALAQTQLNRGNRAEAIAALQQTVRLNPRAAAAEIKLAELLSTSGKVAEGLAHAETAAKLDPRNANARLAVAGALLMKGDLGQADTALALLRRDFPKSADVHALSGVLFDARRQAADATREFDSALAIDPANVKALAGRVAIDIKNGRTADAQARMTRAVSVAPKSPDVLLLAARVDMSAGDPASAERRVRRALEIDPANLDTYDYLGRVYLRQNKLEEARVEFAAMAQRQPDSVAAKTMLGLIYSVQGKLDESRKTYEDIVARNRNAAVAANNLAWMYVVRKERLDEALQLAQDAKQRLPERPEVNDTLGWVYYNKDLPLLAIPPLEICVEKAPKNPIYFLHLGLAYAKAKQPQKARTALEQALKLNPNFPGAEEARSTLGSLKSEP